MAASVRLCLDHGISRSHQMAKSAITFPIWKPPGCFCIFWMDRISISSYFKDNGMRTATPDGSLLLLQHLSCVNHKGAAHHDLHIITWGLRLSAEAAPLSLFYRRPWNSSRELQWEASCQAVSQWESWGRNYGSFFFLIDRQNCMHPAYITMPCSLCTVRNVACSCSCSYLTNVLPSTEWPC